MAGVWRMHRDRRKDGDCYFCDKKIFYLHFFPHAWFPGYRLFVFCFLDEYKKLHSKFQAKPSQVSLTSPQPSPKEREFRVFYHKGLTDFDIFCLALVLIAY